MFFRIEIGRRLERVIRERGAQRLTAAQEAEETARQSARIGERIASNILAVLLASINEGCRRAPCAPKPNPDPAPKPNPDPAPKPNPDPAPNSDPGEVAS